MLAVSWIFNRALLEDYSFWNVGRQSQIFRKSLLPPISVSSALKKKAAGSSETVVVTIELHSVTSQKDVNNLRSYCHESNRPHIILVS